MEDDLKISDVEYLSNHWSDLPNNLWDQSRIKMLEMKTTSNGRIIQQPLLRSSSNFKLKPRGPNKIWVLLEMKTPMEWKTTSWY